jgi:hypothetical protein
MHTHMLCFLFPSNSPDWKSNFDGDTPPLHTLRNIHACWDRVVAPWDCLRASSTSGILLAKMLCFGRQMVQNKPINTTPHYPNDIIILCKNKWTVINFQSQKYHVKKISIGSYKECQKCLYFIITIFLYRSHLIDEHVHFFKILTLSMHHKECPYNRELGQGTAREIK